MDFPVKPVTDSSIITKAQDTTLFPWVEWKQGIYIKPYGLVWNKLHEQHLSMKRICPSKTVNMAQFYNQTFGSVSTPILSARWA